MKTYIVPQTTESVVKMNAMMISVSGNGSKWGGVDTDGSKEPSVKDREWDEM